jgi:Predicted nucleoside-diphosphate sugar epimerases
LTLKSLRNRHLFVADALSVIIATLIAFLVRFEHFQWLNENVKLVGTYLVLTVPLRLGAFYAAGMYRRLWRHASVGELRPIITAAGVPALFAQSLDWIFLPLSGLTPTRVPFSVVFIDTFLTGAFITFPRLMVRIGRQGYMRRRKDDTGKRFSSQVLETRESL